MSASEKVRRPVVSSPVAASGPSTVHRPPQPNSPLRLDRGEPDATLAHPMGEGQGVRDSGEVSNSSAVFTTSTDSVTEQQWNDLLPQFADANFYQTWAYGAVSWGEKQLSHLVLRQREDFPNPESSPLPSLSSGGGEGGRSPGEEGTPGRIVAAAQLRIVKLPLVRAGVAYLRWGPLCRRQAEPEDATLLRRMLAALIAEYVERRGLLLRIVPALFAGDPAAERLLDCLRESGFHREDQSAPYRTIRVDLTATPEVIRKRLDGKWRNQLNAAERNGLTVSEGTGDELYGQFLDLYTEMMARKQFETTVDAGEFRRIQERLPDTQKLLIMISAKDGVPQTGLVAAAVGDMGIYLLGATSNDGMKSKGSYLLQWRMLQRLKERGCRWYDLGGINPDSNPGVYHFKSGMGGEEVTGLGRFELRGNRLSALSVQFAEKLQSIRRRRSIVRGP